MLKINTVKLREDLKTTAEELRALKGILRESGQPRVTWRTHAIRARSSTDEQRE